jgi:uncharacterized protein YjaG (DUF416 family)
MADNRFSTPDAYERWLDETIAPWAPERRIALAAAMAERWLPAYAAFAAAEGWGDPAALRQALDAVWAHLRGRALDQAGHDHHAAQVRRHTPHMDDFDADEALAACVMVHDALACCLRADSQHHAVEAMLSGFGAVEPSWWMVSDAAQRRLWSKRLIQAELSRQLRLVERIGALEHLDEPALDALRRDMPGANIVGVPRPRPARPAEPPRLSNKTLFEQYRRSLQAQLKRSNRPADWQNVLEGRTRLATVLFTEWLGRYRRRQQALDGSSGAPADQPAIRALQARWRDRDLADPEPPGWHPEVDAWIALCLRNPLVDYDARTVGAPHGYGPSLRRLWLAAKRQGLSDEQALESVVAWAHHQPATWPAEDRRRKKSTPEARAAAAVAEHLARAVEWTSTGDLDAPWAATVGGAAWQVRLNDFPDELMYTLLVDGADVGDFHDWPAGWRREE